MRKVKTILIIDDDSDDKDFFREALEETDDSIEYTEVDSAEKALEILKAKGTRFPDLIFLDLNMPRMNGKQALAELKNSKNLRQIPVVIYTTSSQEEDIRETRKMGANYYVTKPIAFEELCFTLQYILGEKWKEWQLDPGY